MAGYFTDEEIERAVRLAPLDSQARMRRELEMMERERDAREAERLRELDQRQREQYFAYLHRMTTQTGGEYFARAGHLHTPFERKKAQERARALLLSHMTKEQRRDFTTTARFRSKGSASGDLYQIHIIGTVRRESDNHEFCLRVLDDALPNEDVLLVRKILIENDEPKFLATANDLTEPPHRYRFRDLVQPFMRSSENR